MADIEFKRGEFQEFRATTKVALGPLEKELPNGLSAGSVIQYDGQLMKYEGIEAPIPQLRGAIKAGWLVPISDTTSVYRPKSTSTMATRISVEEDERQVGSVRARDREAMRDTRPQDRATVRSMDRTAAPSDRAGKRMLLVEEDDARPVATIRSAAKQPTVEINENNAQRIAQHAQNLDTKLTRAVPIVHTGDVDAARSGDVLDELLPDAASTDIPRAGVAGEGNDPHLTEDEKESKAEKEARLAAAAGAAAAARAARLGKLGESPDKPPAVPLEKPVAKTAAARPAPAPVAPAAPPPTAGERLKKAKDLLEQGLIDQSEFDAVKTRVLSEL